MASCNLLGIDPQRLQLAEACVSVGAVLRLFMDGGKKWLQHLAHIAVGDRDTQQQCQGGDQVRLGNHVRLALQTDRKAGKEK